MNKKYTYEQVRQIFTDEGYQLVSDRYVNPHQPLEFVCPKGHQGKVRLHWFKGGGRCSVCRGNAKIAHEEAAAYFESQGCVLLEEFKNSQVPVKYRCGCGNESKIRWYSFKEGQRCKKCQPQRQSGCGNWRWNPDREAVAARKKLANAAHTALKTTLKCLGKKKEVRTQALLGYTTEQLRRSIEKHPNWEKVKNENWSLDHIFPIKAFADFGISDIRLINSIDNLQPALLKDNIRKSSKYNKSEFVEWLRSKGHEIS